MKKKRMEQHHVKYTRTKWKLQYIGNGKGEKNTYS